MTIWVDADSCPRDVKTIIRRAARKRRIPASFVANRFVIREDEWVRMIVVGTEEGAADAYLLEAARPGDVAVTRDILLAERLVRKGIITLNDRGREFDEDSISEIVSMRNFSKSLRESGMFIERDRSFGKKEQKEFADAFDRILTRLSGKDTTIS
ncbi:MAG: DUF188 domain-containing protein [Spirochaetia bacterium]